MKERESNFELLRILCMLSIVMHHYSVHTMWDDGNFGNSNYEFFVRSLAVGGKIAVGIFVLISGYFMAGKEYNMKKNITKARKLILKALGYSISIFLLYELLLSMSVIEKAEFSICNILFPFTFYSYWFVTDFVIILLLSPFINILVDTIDQKKHRLLILILFICFSVVPTLRIFVRKEVGNAAILFIFLFLSASYIRKYDVKVNKIVSLLVSICSILFIVGTIKYRVTHVVERPLFMCDSFYQMYTIPVVLATFGLFFFFKETHLGCISWINRLATTSFSIYIIHDNIIVRSVLWKQIVRGERYQNSSSIYLNAFLGIAGTFVICMAIDLLKSRVQKIFVSSKRKPQIEELEIEQPKT